MTEKPKSRILSGLRLYFILISASVRAKMQYKFDFLASAVAQSVMSMYDYLIVALILWKFETIRGWDIWEVGLLYGVAKIGWGLYRTFGEELDKFENYIVRGDFDSILIRPWPSLFVLMSRNIEITRLGWVFEGLTIGSVSAAHLLGTGDIRPSSVAALLFYALCTACLYLSIGIATSSAAFKIVRIDELQVFTQNAPGTAVLYPLEIYPDWLRYLLLSVFPLGVGNYIPIRYILGKGGTSWNLILPPIVAAIALYVAGLLWSAGEKRYHSTGS